MTKRGNNEGSIYQRSDGRWAGVVSIGGGRGVQKRKNVYGKTRLEVARKLTDVMKAVKDNVPLPPDRLTVAAFAKDWLVGIRLSSLKPKTQESYEGAIRIHLIPTFGRIKLAKLTATHLESLYGDLIESGYSAKSIRIYHACFFAMLEKGVRQNKVNRNEASLVDLPRLANHELPMWTLDQVKTFLAATQGSRLEALFTLAITSGARQGELLGLTWNKVNLEKGEINIRQALQRVDGSSRLIEPKTPRSKRTVALTDIAIGSLRRHRANQIRESMFLGAAWNNEFELVFTTPIGTPLDKDNVTKRELPRVLKAAGISTKLRFHDLRHIAASLALAQGVPIPDVAQMLGHSDAATTLRVYAHAILELSGM